MASDDTAFQSTCCAGAGPGAGVAAGSAGAGDTAGDAAHAAAPPDSSSVIIRIIERIEPLAGFGKAGSLTGLATRGKNGRMHMISSRPVPASSAVKREVGCVGPSRVVGPSRRALLFSLIVWMPALTHAAEPASPSLLVFACDNGMPVVIDARPASRTVFAQIGVRVGSRDEPSGLAGMSHLLEHLLFKEGHGQGARPNPAYSTLRAAGALVNASTDFEITEYHADLPAEAFAPGWDALVSMVTRSAFGPVDVDRERDVVLQ